MKHMEQESGLHSEQPTPDFNHVEDWFELYALIRQVKTIHGSQKDFDAEEIIDLITKVCATEESIDTVTSVGGLRQKVSELILKKGIPRHYTPIGEIDPARDK